MHWWKKIIHNLGFKSVQECVDYTLSNVVFLLTNLGLLSVFVQLFGVHYLLSSATAFIIAAVLQYGILATGSFKERRRPHAEGFTYFLAIEGFTLALVLVSMALLVSVLHVEYLWARLATYFFVAVINLFLNMYVTFRP